MKQALNGPGSVLSCWTRNISLIHKREGRRWNTKREHSVSDLFFRGFQHYYTNIRGFQLQGPWNHQNPQPVTYRKSITGITKDKSNNMDNRSFPPQKPVLFNRNWTSLCYLFPGLANAGELQLCVALSDRLHFFWARSGQLYARIRFTVNLGVCLFFPPSPWNSLRKCPAIVSW